jgi:hypothetical protein
LPLLAAPADSRDLILRGFARMKFRVRPDSVAVPLLVQNARRLLALSGVGTEVFWGQIMLDRQVMLAWMALCGLLVLTLWAFGNF